MVVGTPDTDVSGIADPGQAAVESALKNVAADGMTGAANSVATNNTVPAPEGADAINADSAIDGDNHTADDVIIVVQPHLDIAVTNYSVSAEEIVPNTISPILPPWYAPLLPRLM